MQIFVKAAGRLAPYVTPTTGEETRCVELDAPATLGEIVARLGIPAGLVAFGYSGGELKRMSYRPADGEIITLQQPAAGG